MGIRRMGMDKAIKLRGCDGKERCGGTEGRWGWQEMRRGARDREIGRVTWEGRYARGGAVE